MEIESTTLNHMLDRVSKEYADQEAIVDKQSRLTYAEFHNRVEKFARGLLEMGVGKDDHVGVMMSNRAEWFIATYAIMRVGATMVGLNTWYKRDEFRYALRKTDISTLIMTDSFLENDYLGMLTDIDSSIGDNNGDRISSNELPFLRNVVVAGETPSWAIAWDTVEERARTVSSERLTAAMSEVLPGNTAYILFSSGTTGRPKPISLKHDGLVTNARSIGARLTVTNRDRFWLTLPLFFSFAACNESITAFSHGATIVLQERFEPKTAVDIISSENCTVVYGMANIFREIESLDINLRDVFDSVRLGLLVAPGSLRERFEDDYGVDVVLHGYGLTEVCAICAITQPADAKKDRLETVGHPLTNVDIRIKNPETNGEVMPGEQGEICLNTRTLFEKYYKMPDRTREAFDNEGYFHTGDLGRLDADGRLVFEGRIKDMVRTGGINVSPQEVQNVIEKHPNVKEAVVFGLPDEDKDEIVAAAVRSREKRSIETDDVIEFCNERISSYKVPEVIHVQDSDFPRTDTGKVRKSEIKTNVFGQ